MKREGREVRERGERDRACTGGERTRGRRRRDEREKPDEINEDGVEKKGGQRKSAGLNREGGRYSTSRVNLRELMTCEVLIDAL